MDEIQPLVSVPVITYNSSKTVVETLDSIYSQTYPNLELIVSDDCSTDNTVDICRKWIDAHKDRFVRTELLTVEKNTGVSGNLNRAERACHGEWVKGIAGDDVLTKDCVESNIEYVKQHPQAFFVFSALKPFGGNKELRDGINNHYKEHQFFFQWSIKKQYAYLTLEKNCLPAAAFFYNRLAMQNLGVANDERIPFLEDWPKWINLLKKGARFHFMEKETVLYRLHQESLSTANELPKKYIDSLFLFYLLYQFEDLYKAGRKKEAVKRYIQAKKVLTDNFFWRCVNHISKRLL